MEARSGVAEGVKPGDPQGGVPPAFWGTTLARPVAVPTSQATVAEPPARFAEDADLSPDADARRIAQLLVSEIVLRHETAIQLGRQARDLMKRLGPEVERARRVYEGQVSAEVRARTSYLEQELVRALAGGDASLIE